MKFFAETHIGNIRRTNQDCVYIPQDESGYYALVADGMGGHSAGEVASGIFLETARTSLEPISPEEANENTVKKIFSLANTNIYHKSNDCPQMKGMGTTATLAVFCGHRLLIGHVGDSRAYLFSNGSLSQITHDHSYVQRLVDSGLISQEDAASHPQKNIILRALGSEKRVKADIYQTDLKCGDVVLLCTDGLFGLVSDSMIADILKTSVHTAAQRLIDAALAAGGYDNISVALAVLPGGKKMNGRVLGDRYEIIKAIDSGGMAYIYKAYCMKTNTYVAVKMLKEKFCTNADYVRRFKKEAESAFMLDHENIVRVRDIGCDEGDYYMVMDYIEGSTLKSLIEQKGALDEKDALLIAIQICAALSAAHKHGIIHRDIKPQNILLDKENNAKLTDFGIAKSINTTKQQMEKQVMGSVYYISPEQARNEAIDARSDIYSLGILLYEMLTGELPHTGEQTVSVALKHINEQLRPPSEINPSVSASLSNIVLKATSKNRKDRYRTADALKQDLTRALVDPSGEFVDIPHSSNKKKTYISPQDHKKQKTIKIIVLVFLIAALAIGATFGISLFLSPGQRILSVPDMIGRDLEYATTVLSRMGFSIELLYDFSETTEEGYVIAQTPAPEEMGMRGDTVTLTVSSGSAGLTMPDLTGIQLEEAQAILQEMGLLLEEIIYEFSEEFPEGTVISYIPAEDIIIAEGDSVTLIVSGEAVAPGAAMPQLAGLPVQQAVLQLNELGFLSCFVYEDEDSTSQDGTVLEQSSIQGAPTPFTTRIDLWISAYKEKPYHGTFYAHLDIPDKDSRVSIVLETQIEDVIVNFVVFETQIEQEGMFPVVRDILSLTGGSKTVRVYVNNIEVQMSEVMFVG